MTQQEANHEAEELIQLFLMCTSSKDEAKKCAIFSTKKEIELMEKIFKEKFIVHWAEEKFNKLLQDKNLVLQELKK